MGGPAAGGGPTGPGIVAQPPRAREAARKSLRFIALTPPQQRPKQKAPDLSGAFAILVVFGVGYDA
jgi:hypothetical protein